MSTQVPSYGMQLRMFNIYFWLPGVNAFIAVSEWHRGRHPIAVMATFMCVFYVCAYPRFLLLVWRSMKGEW